MPPPELLIMRASKNQSQVEKALHLLTQQYLRELCYMRLNALGFFLLPTFLLLA